ncbi:MAG: hypothetical protein Q7T18_04140 [Sedimentisphaerales bacterium]|nr:hypothetical protein [Sedimentisphaerales bacterium]
MQMCSASDKSKIAPLKGEAIDRLAIFKPFVAKDVADFFGEADTDSLRGGFEFELLHILGGRFISPAEKGGQPGQKSKPRTFFVMRNHSMLHVTP